MASRETQVPITTDNMTIIGGELQKHQSEGVESTTDVNSNDDAAGEEGRLSGVRRVLGFGRKTDPKDKGKNKAGLQLGDATSQTSQKSNVTTSDAPMTSPNHPYMVRSTDRNLQTSSPRIVSPAGSQIFERDVQDSTTLPAMPASPVPGHLQVDDHIPSVLDASSEAITNTSLDPDAVEIVMHSAHQPAAMTMTGNSAHESMSNSWAEDLVSHPNKDDAMHNYGALDAADVRRLSFISFADVVQSEQAEHAGSRDQIHVAGLTSLSPGHRSPSPMRSPVSTQSFNTSPPPSKTASTKGLELSPSRAAKPLASPTFSAHGSVASGGELMIETMSQALRKTQSGDLSGARSPVNTDGYSERVLQ